MKKKIKESSIVDISLMVDTELREEINQLVQKKIEMGDFSYSSFNNFLIKTLSSYQRGELKPIFYQPKEKKKRITVVIRKEQLDFYNSFPSGNKSIMINSILKSQLEKELKNI